MSIYQTNLIRLIGYSAIIHISYALLGTVEGNSLGLSSGYLYIIGYCILNISIFIIIIILKNNKLIDQLYLIEILDFLKVLKSNLLLSCISASIFFSMAGIPPLSGFFIKMYVYNSLGVSYNYIILIILLIVGVINAIYYIRLIRLAYLIVN
jgi:NADH-quinone oxidoreductase subunit N